MTGHTIKKPERNWKAGISPGFWAALGVVAGGIVIRVYGLDFGLPFIYVMDELDFIGRALNMLATGDPNPRWFGHPGTPMIYLLALIFAGKLSVGTATLPDMFYLARLSIVVFAAGSILLTYLIGNRVADRYTGLLAAAFIAVAPLHIEYSRIARPDIQMTFFMLASTWFVISIAREGRWRDYLAAGFLLGIAVALKYPALFLAPVVVWAHALNRRKEHRPVWTNPSMLIGSGVATCSGFLAGTPFILAEHEIAWASLIRESRPFHLSATSDGFASSLWWYLTDTLMANIGVLGLLMATAGIWAVVRRRDPAASIVLVCAVCTLVFISFLSLRWSRWAIPALPFVGLLAAIGFRDVYQWLRARLPESLRAVAPACAIIAAALMLAGATVDSVSRARAFGHQDARTLAWDWIMETVPPESAILAEARTPQLPEGRFRLYRVEDGRIVPNDAFSQQFIIPLDHVMPMGSLGELNDIRSIDRVRIDYLVLSNEYDRRKAEPFHPGQEALYAELKRTLFLYEEIMGRYELVFESWPEPGKTSGNHIRIYRTPAANRVFGTE